MQQPETPDIEITPGPAAEAAPPPPPPPRRGWSSALGLAALLAGLAALGASAFVYNQTQRELRRAATDIAQLRLSMELFARQQGTPSGTDQASLQDLSNRLAILEANWRGAPSGPAPALPALPEAGGSAAADGGDCLPTGTRFLVSSGDRYPVCGTTGVVEIGAVDNGFIALGDGTIIAAGGTVGLPSTNCMIGVVSAGEDGMTGFAEIRVTC